MKIAAAAVLVALALPLAAVAQEPAPARRPRPEPPAREEAWKLVDAYILSNLQESLELSDAQFVKLLPLVKTLQSSRRGFMQKRVQLLGELRRQVRSGETTQPRVEELMQQLRTLETEEPSIVRGHMDAIDSVLTPVQQAKYRILELEVERRLRELMQRMRNPGERGDGRGRREPGVPQQPPPQDPF